MKSICVFCASSLGTNAAYVEAARSLGMAIAKSGARLVYGGGKVGLMGVVADAVLAAGGEAHGVITSALFEKEIAHDRLTQLDVVTTMHERKERMADASDAIVMLPGSFGTLEEFLEAVTWTQLGIHSKPCGVLNVDGFFDPLVELLDNAVRARLLRAEHRDLLLVESEVAPLLQRLDSWTHVNVDKWLDRHDR